MATPPTLDVDSFLKPVSAEQPAGPDLRSATGADREIYFAVRDARRKAGDAERRFRGYLSLSDEDRKAEPGGMPEPADWEAVCRLSIEALGKSKDLWITAWLIEAMTRIHGYAGLRDGFRVARGLCEKFWPELHPRPDEGENLETTFAQLAGLNGVDSDGTLLTPIMSVPITADTTAGQFSCADYKDASDLEQKDPKLRSRRVEQGAVSLDSIQRAVAETTADFFQDVLEDLQQAAQAFAEFNELICDRANDMEEDLVYLPPSSDIRERLDECLRLVRGLAKSVLPDPQPADNNGVDVKPTPPEPSALFSATPIQTREEAFRRLLQVSDYFRRAEPHSPVSYALEQVVRWGHMSLPELLLELVSDKSVREDIFKRTGITEPPKE